MQEKGAEKGEGRGQRRGGRGPCKRGYKKQQQMEGGCNRQIHFAAVAAATVGELWFFYVCDNIKLNQRWTGLGRASRGGGRAGSGRAEWLLGQAGRQAISIKWLALKISGRTIKTPFRSGSVKPGESGRAREMGVA